MFLLFCIVYIGSSMKKKILLREKENSKSSEETTGKLDEGDTSKKRCLRHSPVSSETWHVQSAGDIFWLVKCSKCADSATV